MTKHPVEQNVRNLIAIKDALKLKGYRVTAGSCSYYLADDASYVNSVVYHLEGDDSEEPYDLYIPHNAVHGNSHPFAEAQRNFDEWFNEIVLRSILPAKDEKAAIFIRKIEAVKEAAMELGLDETVTSPFDLMLAEVKNNLLPNYASKD